MARHRPLKPYTKFQMPGFKRNQVEEAISRVLEPPSPEPTSDLRTRLKRLLDTDRALVGIGVPMIQSLFVMPSTVTKLPGAARRSGSRITNALPS